MISVHRHIYRALVRMHPAAFRNEFGREMALDFEDALASSGFAPLCLDALLSLGRQWAARLLPHPAEQLPARRLSLLAGDYVMIEPGGPTLFNLLKASVLASMVLLTLCSVLKTPTRHTAIDLPASSGSQPKGIYSPARHSTPAADDTSDTSTLYSATLAVGQSAGTSGTSAGDSETAEAQSLKQIAFHSSSIDPELLTYLWQLAAFLEFVWLMVLLLYKRPSIGKKIVFALFGLTAFAAPLAFSSTPAAALLLAGFAQPQPTPELVLFHPSGPSLTYEVATIKPLDPEAANTMVKLPPGGGLSPLSIRRYIMDAYGATYAQQVAGGPDWLNKDAFLIHGKVPDDLEAAMQKMTYQERTEQNRRMQQSLLASRFHLVAHFETRVLPVYELVPAKSGLKIAEVPAPPERKPGDPPMPLAPGNPLPPGTSRTMFNSKGLRVLNARAIKMELLARILGPDAGDRPIVNHTGFTGSFDITDLTWAPLGDASANDAPDAPSLTVAMEKTLGIKLVPTKAPIEVLVIDHIEKPSEN